MMSLACLCGCGKIASCRGLWKSCYERTTLAIREGRTTEQQEMDAGRLLPKKQSWPEHRRYPKGAAKGGDV
jgi:hypothetical protein